MNQEQLTAAIQAEQDPANRAALIAEYEAQFGPYHPPLDDSDSGGHGGKLPPNG